LKKAAASDVCFISDSGTAYTTTCLHPNARRLLESTTITPTTGSRFFSGVRPIASHVSQLQARRSGNDYFRCMNGKRIDMFFVCDSIDDCGDMSDEEFPYPCSGASLPENLTAVSVLFLLLLLLLFLLLFFVVAARYYEMVPQTADSYDLKEAAVVFSTDSTKVPTRLSAPVGGASCDRCSPSNAHFLRAVIVAFLAAVSIAALALTKSPVQVGVEYIHPDLTVCSE
jgi:hypothetical protein